MIEIISLVASAMAWLAYHYPNKYKADFDVFFPILLLLSIAFGIVAWIADLPIILFSFVAFVSILGATIYSYLLTRLASWKQAA